MGDVHAVSLVCSSTSYLPKLQAALWGLVQAMDIRSDRPDPAFEPLHRQILSHTFLRKANHVSGCYEYGEEVWQSPDDPRVQAAMAVAKYLNGDWRLQRLVHHCGYGCGCASEDDTKEKVYACLLACDVLCSSGKRLPSNKDWGSVWEHASRQCFGMMCHSILPQAVRTALPNFSAMEPPLQPSDDHQLGDIQEFRKFLRCKAWRCSCVVQDVEKKKHWVISSWTLEPVDQCLLRVRWMDSRGSALLDAVSPKRSPFRQLRRALLSMLVSPDHLAPAIFHLPDSSDTSDTIVKQVISLLAEVWLRFLQFEIGPLLLALSVDPSLTGEEQQDAARAFFDTKDCCTNTHFGANAKGLFDSAEAMMNDPRWRRSFYIFCRYAKLCNMNVERYFAAVRNAVSSDGTPDIETIRTSGFMSEVLTAHTLAGGDDPRVTTSKELLAQGVPLRWQKPVARTKSASSFALWSSCKERERKEAGISLASCGGRRVRYRRLSEEWAGVDAQEKLALGKQGIADAAKRKTVAANQPERDDVRRLHGPGFWGYSEIKAPFSEAAFTATITEKMGCLPGACQYLQEFRASFRQDLFIRDSGVVRAGDQILQRIPCWSKHPGLCTELDAEIYSCVKAVAEAIRLRLDAHVFYRLSARERGGDEVSVLAYAAIARPSATAMLMCRETGDDEISLAVFEQDHFPCQRAIMHRTLAGCTATFSHHQSGPNLMSMSIMFLISVLTLVSVMTFQNQLS